MPINRVVKAIEEIKAGRMVIWSTMRTAKMKAISPWLRNMSRPEAINFMARVRTRPDLSFAHGRALPGA